MPVMVTACAVVCAIRDVDQRVELQREQSLVQRGKPRHADARQGGVQTGRRTDRTCETRGQTTEPAGRETAATTKAAFLRLASLRCAPAHLLLLFHAPPIHLTLSSHVLHHPSVLPHRSLVFFDFFLPSYRRRGSSSRPPTGLQTLCCMMLEGDALILVLRYFWSRIARRLQ